MWLHTALGCNHQSFVSPVTTFMFGCSGTQLYDPESGMKTRVSLETTIEPHDLVYYLGLELALHERKAKVLPLDHRCLLINAPGSITHAQAISGAVHSNKEIGQTNVESITNKNKLDSNLRSQILLAVHSKQQLKNKRSSSLVLTGLRFNSAEDEVRSSMNLCEQEFSILPTVPASSRLGKQLDGRFFT